MEESSLASQNLIQVVALYKKKNMAEFRANGVEFESRW